MASVGHERATPEDLYRTPGKAELIGGRIVEYVATGRKPSRVAGGIYRFLDDYAPMTSRGEAYTDSMGFAVPELPSGRESFSPDASYFFGPLPDNPTTYRQGDLAEAEPAVPGWRLAVAGIFA